MTFTKSLGNVGYSESARREFSIPRAVLIAGCGAVGAYVGFRIGGGHGAAIGAIVGTFMGAFAAGCIRSLKVIVHPSGKFEAECETCFS